MEQRVVALSVDELGFDVFATIRHLGIVSQAHERLIPALRKLWEKIGLSVNWAQSTTVILLSGHCCCCEGGRVLAAGVRHLREAGFQGTIITVTLMGDDALDLGALRNLPGVVPMFRPTVEEILQQAGLSG